MLVDPAKRTYCNVVVAWHSGVTLASNKNINDARVAHLASHRRVLQLGRFLQDSAGLYAVPGSRTRPPAGSPSPGSGQSRPRRRRAIRRLVFRPPYGGVCCSKCMTVRIDVRLNHANFAHCLHRRSSNISSTDFHGQRRAKHQ